MSQEKIRPEKLEFNRCHMIAVRLVDFLNYAATERIPAYEPILDGFRLTLAWQSPGRRKLTMRPAGWAKGNKIECLLKPQEGGVRLLSEGVIASPWGTFTFHGEDRGTSLNYQSVLTQLSLSIDFG